MKRYLTMRYLTVIMIVVVSCTLLQACGTMPAPGLASRSVNNSDNSQTAATDQVQPGTTSNGLQQMLSQNVSGGNAGENTGRASANTSNPATLDDGKPNSQSASSSVGVKSPGIIRHNRILDAINTTMRSPAARPVSPSSTRSSLNSDTGKFTHAPTKTADNIGKAQTPTKSSNTSHADTGNKVKSSSSPGKVALRKPPEPAARNTGGSRNKPKKDQASSEDNITFALARRYYQEGRYNDAIGFLNSLSKNSLKIEKYRALLVLAYGSSASELLVKGKPKKAQSLLERALAIEPNNKSIRLQLTGIKNGRKADRIFSDALNAFNDGDKQKAYFLFDQVLQLNPAHKKAKVHLEKSKAAVVDNYHKKAMQYYRRQKLSQAIEQWDSLLKVDPGNDLARIYRSRALELKRKFEKL